MPYSSNEGKDTVINWIDSVEHNRILDIGPGSGVYADLINTRGMWYSALDAVEAWTPYIDMFNLKSKYTNVINIDVRNHDDFNYDIIILGDILEHMSKEDAVSLWDKCSKNAKYAVISIPIIHYPQGHEFGNPFEEHVKDDWTALEVLQTFSNINKMELYSTIGIFFANFNGGNKNAFI